MAALSGMGERHGKGLERDCSGCILSKGGSSKTSEISGVEQKPHGAKLWRKSVKSRGKNVSPNRVSGIQGAVRK